MDVSDTLVKMAFSVRLRRDWFAACGALRLLAAALGVLVPIASHAIGTAAGTNIQSSATVDYSIGGNPASATSNVSSVDVAEILDVTVVLQSAAVSSTAGAAGEALVFRVTNTGNAAETFVLAGNSVLTGDDFDPVPAAPFVYFDSDGSGDLSPPDVPYVPGGNDPVLAADSSIGLIVVNDMPATLADNSRGRSELAAAAATGTGAPGTVYAGQGAGGVDAVVGTSGGRAVVFGEYVVGAIQISAVKSQTVLDPFGGNRPLPGATIRYQIVVTPTGSGTAVGATVTDAMPASTSYVAGSLQLNGAALTDAADADAGVFASSPAAEIAVSLGDLTATSGPQTIAFSVTID
jgi:uncharacterized repeat protein (TIGR01451 family)